MGIIDFIPILGRILDRVLPDKAASEAAKLKVMELAQAGELAELDANVKLATGQLEVDKIEAASPNMFIAGGRPFLMWVLAGAFAVQYVIAPIGEWLAALAGYPVKFPTLDIATMTPVLLGMLGLGTMRTVEKIKGAEGNR